MLQEAELDVAVSLFAASQAALDLLGKTAPDKDGRTAARARLPDLHAALRLCLHRAGQPVDASAEPAAPAPAAAAAAQRLSTRAAAAAAADADMASDAAAGASTWRWRGVDFAVPDNARVRDRLAAAAAAAPAAQPPAAADPAVLAAHASACEAAASCLAAAGAALEAGADSSDDDADARLRAAVSIATAEARINQFTARGLALHRKFCINAANAVSGVKTREKGARPADAVKLFDALHRAALDLETAAAAPGLPAAVVQALVAASAAAAAVYSAARCFFAAHARLARGEAVPAAAMFDAARDRAAGADTAALGPLQAEVQREVRTGAAAYSGVARLTAAAAAERTDGEIAGAVKVRSPPPPLPTPFAAR